MKRLLFIAAILLAFCWPIFAAPVTSGGTGSELTYGFITDGSQVKDRWTNLVICFPVQVNDSNFVNFGLISTTTPALNSFNIRAFSGNFIADKLLGLPKGTSLRFVFGIDDILGVNYMPSDYEYENQIPQYDGGGRPTIAAVFSTTNFGLNIVGDPGTTIVGYEPLRSASLMVNPYGAIPIDSTFKLQWSGQYYNPDLQNGMLGKAGGDLYLTATSGLWMAGFDTEGTYNLDDPSLGIIGFALIGGWNGYTLDVSTNYSKPSATNSGGFNLLGFGLELRFFPDVFGVSIGADMNLNPQVDQMLRSVDAGIWIKSFAPGKIRMGYLWTRTGNGGGDFYAPAALTNGGWWVKYDISW
jgi:hypothetical protein